MICFNKNCIISGILLCKESLLVGIKFSSILAEVIQNLEKKEAASEWVEVKNLNGTSDKQCVSCGSWLEHWEHKNENEADKCVAKNCSNDAQVGAHVKKVGSKDNHHYIVPLCKGCNNKSSEETFEVPRTYLASAVKCADND